MEKEKIQVDTSVDDDSFLNLKSPNTSFVKNTKPVYFNIKWSFGILMIIAG